MKLFSSQNSNNDVSNVCRRTVRYSGNITKHVKHLKFNQTTEYDVVMQQWPEEEEKKGTAGARQTSLSLLAKTGIIQVQIKRVTATDHEKVIHICLSLRLGVDVQIMGVPYILKTTECCLIENDIQSCEKESTSLNSIVLQIRV